MTHIYGIDEAGRPFVEAAAQVAESARRFANDVDRLARFPEEAMDAITAHGLLALCVPTESGGHGQPPGVFAGVVEQLAQACSSTAMIYVMHVVATHAISASSSLAERESILRAVAAGKHLSTLAFSESGSRSQFWSPVSRLQEHNGSYRTTATNSWVTAANHADSYVSSAQAPAAESPLESTLYLFRRTAPGVRVSGNFDGLGLRGNDSAPVEITDLVVTHDDLLTPLGGGATAMLEVVLPWFVVGSSAMANGICLAAVSATQAHLANTSFQHDGRKLRDLPNLRARLAEMSSRTEQSRAMLGYTVRCMLAPDDQTPLRVLQSRMAALEAATHVTDLAMKACGGAAFSRHLGVEQMFRDARAGWVMAPTVDHLHEFVGRALTGLPLF